MRRLAISFTLVGLLLIPPSTGKAEAQLYFGGHMAYATDLFGGATGAGLRLGYDFPVLPIDILVAGEYFFPDCEVEDCGLWGGSVEGLVRLPIPLVRPYALVGLTYRDYDNHKSSSDTVDSGSNGGFSAGLGLDLNLLALRVFLDARYEILEEPTDQWVIRLGLNF